jgi:hypothetical protein
MATEEPNKILRIGILQGGRIVGERLVDPGTAVTIGTSAHNLFVFPETHLPDTEYTLFAPTRDGYALRVTPEMGGRLSTGGATVRVSAIRSDPSATVIDGIARMPLTPTDRGKIEIDQVTVLFQFVTAPPRRVAPPLARMDFRPRLLDEDDPVFLGFLATWSALATMLLVWVWGTEPMEFTLEDAPEILVRLSIPPTVEPDDVEVVPSDVGEQVVREIEDSDAVADADLTPPDDVVPEAVRRAVADQERIDDLVRSNPLIVSLLTTTGEAKDLVQEMWSGDEGLGELDELLAEREGATTGPDEDGPRGCQGCEVGSRDIDDLAEVGGGGGTSEDAMRVTHEVHVPEGIWTGTGDPTSVGDVVGTYAGQLQYCYEARLKVVPNLGGRVEMAWTVEDGSAVGTPYVVVNTTGDGELADCVARKIRRWRFPADVEGDATYPFVFRPKK